MTSDASYFFDPGVLILPPNTDTQNFDVFFRLLEATKAELKSDINGMRDTTSAKLDAIGAAVATLPVQINDLTVRVNHLEIENTSRSQHVADHLKMKVEVAKLTSLVDAGKGSAGLAKSIWNVIGGPVTAALMTAGLWIYGQMHQPQVEQQTTISRTISAR